MTGEIIWSIYDSGLVEDKAHIAIDGYDATATVDVQVDIPAALRDLAAVAGALADELDTDKTAPPLTAFSTAFRGHKLHHRDTIPAHKAAGLGAGSTPGPRRTRFGA